MRHDIERLLAHCDQVISAAEARERDAVAERHAAWEKDEARKRQLRAQAGARLAAIAAVLGARQELGEADVEFLVSLPRGHFHRYDVDRDPRVSDFTDAPVPEPRPRPAATDVYGLRDVLRNLRRDNPGVATVSTTALKEFGFGARTLQWVARV